MSRDTDVYLTPCSVKFRFLRNLTTIKTTIQITVINTTKAPIPKVAYNVTLLPSVPFSGCLLEVLVSVAKFVVLSVVVTSVEGFVDSVGAEEDGDVCSGGVSVGVTLQSRSEYISTL